ncbi:transposable element Tcb2 transposase [Trichonephila clavipes]|nr:transposable element Tcb2 transposase [Trichonephila clavipes]
MPQKLILDGTFSEPPQTSTRSSYSRFQQMSEAHCMPLPMQFILGSTVNLLSGTFWKGLCFVFLSVNVSDSLSLSLEIFDTNQKLILDGTFSEPPQTSSPSSYSRFQQMSEAHCMPLPMQFILGSTVNLLSGIFWKGLCFVFLSVNVSDSLEIFDTNQKLLGAVDTRRYSRTENRVWSDQEDHEERGSKDRAASVSDSFNDTSRSNCFTNNFRHLAEKFKSKCSFALPLTPKHRQLRLQWCEARSMWNVTDWQKFAFSDESRFVLGSDDNRVRVWRPHFNSPHCSTSHCSHSWCNGPGAIAYDNRSTLIVMRGTLTGQCYGDDILRPHVGPFLNGLPGAIFQQDNARPHTTRVAQDFLQLAVQDLCAHLPQDYIRCLINSMPDRMAACIAAGGGPTRY